MYKNGVMVAILPAQCKVWRDIPPVDWAVVYVKSWAAKEHWGHLEEDTI